MQHSWLTQFNYLNQPAAILSAVLTIAHFEVSLAVVGSYSNLRYHIHPRIIPIHKRSVHFCYNMCALYQL